MSRILLTDLPMDKMGKVMDLNCTGNTRRRLLDLGMIKGTNICPVLKSPSGDPTAFLVRGSTIAIRKEDAKLINVEY